MLTLNFIRSGAPPRGPHVPRLFAGIVLTVATPERYRGLFHKSGSSELPICPKAHQASE